MASDSRVIAWRIPWAEEPGRLQSMGSQSGTTKVTERACADRRDYMETGGGPGRLILSAHLFPSLSHYILYKEI